MEEKETKPIETPKKLESIDFIYLGVLFLSFIIIVIVFFYSTSFIIGNVNKIFSQNNATESHALEINKYSLLAKKLNLPVNEQTSNIVTTPPVVNTLPPTTTPETTKTINPEATPNTTTPPTTELDKKSLIIDILNGARKAGVASSMSTELENAGFSKGATGDSKNIYPITTIMIKDTKKDYTTLIETVVKKLHPKATTTTTNPESSKFDVIIIVGKE
jgi:hypothetical protein